MNRVSNPSMVDARNAMKKGTRIDEGIGAYRAVYWRKGDFWCYKIPLGLVANTEDIDSMCMSDGVEDLAHWTKEGSLSCQVEYYNYKRILQDWGSHIAPTRLYARKMRLPEMKILSGVINGTRVRVIAVEHISGDPSYDVRSVSKFSELYSLDDMHSNNVLLDKKDYLVPIDLGEDILMWSTGTVASEATLQQYQQHLKGLSV